MPNGECPELEFKPDWPESARRLEAWWDCQIVDRVVVMARAPRDGVRPREIPPPPTVEERWTNIEYVLDVAQERFRTTYFGGDAFPTYQPNLGPDIIAGYLGSPIEFAETTSWAHPIVEDWDQTPSLRLAVDNRWWKLTCDLTAAATAVAPGRFLVEPTDLHGGLDAIAALRGRARLCLDLIEHPQAIRRAVDALIPIWKRTYDTYLEIASPRMVGTSGWLPMWSARRASVLQCDFCCMISPAMFREFVMPHLVAEARHVDRSAFHLDGPGAIVHLDALFEVPKLQAIQWVPGANSGPALQWLPLLKRIQAAGRAIHMAVLPEEVEPLVRELRPGGLLLSTNCRSEGEARDLVRRVGKATPRGSVFAVG